MIEALGGYIKGVFDPGAGSNLAKESFSALNNIVPLRWALRENPLIDTGLSPEARVKEGIAYMERFIAFKKEAVINMPDAPEKAEAAKELRELFALYRGFKQRSMETLAVYYLAHTDNSQLHKEAESIISELATTTELAKQVIVALSASKEANKGNYQQLKAINSLVDKDHVGTSLAVQALCLGSFNSEDRELRAETARVLAKVQDPEGFKALLRLGLMDDEWTVQVAALSSLRQIANPAAADAVIKYSLNSSSRQVQEAAVSTLSAFLRKTGDVKIFKALRELVRRSEYRQLRIDAINAMFIPRGELRNKFMAEFKKKA